MSVLRKCHVAMTEYFVEYRPLDVSEDDVYVCENRYSEKHKSISKCSSLGQIKLPEGFPEQEYLTLKTPLVLQKVSHALVYVLSILAVVNSRARGTLKES